MFGAGKRPEREDKPPTGLKPKWMADEQRMVEISVAITQYMGSCKPIPKEWLAEYNKLAAEYQKREDKKRRVMVDALIEADKYR